MFVTVNGHNGEGYTYRYRISVKGNFDYNYRRHTNILSKAEEIFNQEKNSFGVYAIYIEMHSEQKDEPIILKQWEKDKHE